MSTLLAEISSGRGHPMLPIIFWLLLLFWLIGAFLPDSNPYLVRGSKAVLIILFAILGYYSFGF